MKFNEYKKNKLKKLQGWQSCSRMSQKQDRKMSQFVADIAPETKVAMRQEHTERKRDPGNQKYFTH